MKALPQNTNAPYAGPFAVGDEYVDPEGNDCVAIEDADGRVFAKVRAIPGTWRQERNATARLLAASSELLSACVAAEDALNPGISDSARRRVKAMVFHAIAAARKDPITGLCPTLDPNFSDLHDGCCSYAWHRDVVAKMKARTAEALEALHAVSRYNDRLPQGVVDQIRAAIAKAGGQP